MKYGIKELIKERGLKLSDVARQLGINRHNMSAIASGSRNASLKALKKISRILDTSVDELLVTENIDTVYKSPMIDSLIDKIETCNYDGVDKSWVDRAMLAQRAHYLKARKAG